MTTALELVRTLPFLPTVAAMGFMLVPIFALPIAAWAIVEYQALWRTKGMQAEAGRYFLLFLLTVAALFSSPWVIAAMTLLAVLHVLSILARVFGWKRRLKSFGFSFYKLQMVFNSLIVVSVLAGPAWLPQEKIEIDGTATTISIVSAEEDELIVLNGHTHLLQRIDADSIDTREYCSADFSFFTSPLYVLADEDSYPECPRAPGS